MSASRRTFLVTAVSAAAAALAACRKAPAKGTLGPDAAIAEFNDAGQPTGVVTVPTIVKTDAEWRDQLSTMAFDVTRHEGTEPSFSGQYWNNHEGGVYRCVCCGTAVFSSDAKFESGTGWPSFTQPIARENIVETEDSSFGMIRTAVACRRCQAHLGHVFTDGPPPTGLRYCINSVALAFVKFRSGL